MSPATFAVMEDRAATAHFGNHPGPVINAGSLPVPTPYSPLQRRRTRLDISLFELDPREVVDGVMLDNGMYLAPDPIFVGTMRETCPHCDGVALQLILRRHQVKRSHLFCTQCTRCYDALCEGGYSILGII